jgi:hypothetical protein
VIIGLLPTVHSTRARLGDYLVDVALLRRSQSSKALYHAILALAFQHRDNNLLEAERLKSAALSDLLTHDHTDSQDGIEHIAANLLLCVLEV